MADCRMRKSSGAGSALSRSSSPSAFSWLRQSSALVSFLEPSHLAPEPLCEATFPVQRTSPGQVPIHARNAAGQLLQSSPSAVLRVRRVPLVCPPICADRTAHAHARNERIKSAESLKKTAKKRPYGFVNGNSPSVFMPDSESYHLDCLMVTLEASK